MQVQSGKRGLQCRVQLARDQCQAGQRKQSQLRCQPARSRQTECIGSDAAATCTYVLYQDICRWSHAFSDRICAQTCPQCLLSMSLSLNCGSRLCMQQVAIPHGM